VYLALLEATLPITLARGAPPAAVEALRHLIPKLAARE
jgi:hypothetical protein